MSKHAGKTDSTPASTHVHTKKNQAALPLRIELVLIAIALLLAWLGGFPEFWYYPAIGAAVFLAWGLGVGADAIFAPKERPHGSGVGMLWVAVGVTTIVIFYEVFMVMAA